MATLAALLKTKGYDVRGSDQNVYPPMSDFLVQQGITLLQGYRPEHITRRPRPGRRRQRHLARQRRARGSARPEDPLLLAARSGPRSLPLGRAVGRHRRHARQDDDDVADGLAADPRRRRSERVHRRHRRELRRQLPHRRRPRVRDRRRRIRQRLLRQDGEVPEVPARHRRRQQHRVRPRRHLPGPRRDPAGVPALRQPDPAARAAAARRRQRRTRWRCKPRAHCRVETFGLSTARDWQAHDLQVSESSTRFSVRRGGTPVGTFEVPLLGAYNVRNALAAIAVGAAVGLSIDTMAAVAAARSRASGGGCSIAARCAGVAVYDDFAHHPTAIARDARRRALGVSAAAHLGDLRAALGDVVPARLSVRLRPGAGRGRPVVLPAVFRSTLPEDRAAVDRAADRRSARRPASTPATSRRPTTSSRPWRARARRRRSRRRSCRTAASTTFTRSCCRRSRRG